MSCNDARKIFAIQTKARVEKSSATLHKVESLVVTIISLYAIIFLLGGLKKRFWITWVGYISSLCYMALPILISYTFGLMGEPMLGDESVFTNIFGDWAVFLFFTYASFDNLNAFNLEEIKGRSKLWFQFLSQVGLLFWIWAMGYWSKYDSSARLVVLFLACLKVLEKLTALRHAAGASHGIEENLRKMMVFFNKDEASSRSMYLVGPRYATTKDGEIVEGVTLEKIWECNGRLLSSESGGGDLDGQLKDTCLSFSLVWVLIAKVRGYTNLYTTPSSGMKAWEFFDQELLSNPDRAFRVVEVELSFLQDYFYSKYMLFYLNGFYLKLISLIGLPIMYWYFIVGPYRRDFSSINDILLVFDGVDPKLTPNAYKIMILVLFALEMIQLLMFLTSKWFIVTLVCFYANKKPGFLRHCFGGVIGAVCRVSRYTRAVMCPTWKKKIYQYSLLESCTSFSITSHSLEAICSIFGFSLAKLFVKKGKSVALSKDVKREVVLSLRTNGPNLSNGVASLRRSALEEKLSWALNLKNRSEAVLVWHIATGICEMNYNKQDPKPKGFEVATTLSKYCAYLLVFAPLLISVPVLDAEVVYKTTIKEARALLRKEIRKYDKLMEHTSDKEVQEGSSTVLQKGIVLGTYMVSIADDERRWQILAEFWAEFILFLAPSDINEMDHVENIAEGGEFITQLWALLIHAGIDSNNSAKFP